MLHYILQVVLFQLLFLIVYDVFLRKETFFNINRVYLLGTAVLSVIIPFIKIEQIKNVVAKDLVIRLPEIILGSSTEDFSTINPEIAMQAGINLDPEPVSIWNIIVISGMCLATLILVIKISKLLRLASKHPRYWSGDLLIIELLNSTKAFSFFHYIFLGQQLNTQDKSAIMAHEKVHVQQKHTLDLLFFELLRIVFWFNPLVYMYQKRMATLHEFIADSRAVKNRNKTDYYDNLLAQVFETQHFSFVNPFFKQSLIKKRIIMLSKSKSRQINLFKYVLLIPVVLSMLIFSSCSVFKSNQDKAIVKKDVNVLENRDLDKDQMNDIEIPFSIIDEVPVFKSCEAIETNIERKKCVSQAISKYVNLNFNINIADSLKLVGRQRINVLFKIDKEGRVTGVRARAPHPALEEEAKRVINTLPQFVPGKHKGKAVIVPYSLPIVFQIQGTSKTQTKAKTKAKEDATTDKIKELKTKFKDADEVPFMALDEVPGIGECSGLSSSKEQKACFSMYISKYVNKNYNVELASSLGLVGRQRINVIFKIDKQGLITGARARAPHPELETEAIRVINSLPQFTPGKLNGKPVVVTYSLPILFQMAANSKQDKKD